MNPFPIRPLATMEEFLTAEAIQRAVWGDENPVPAAMLKIVTQNGGVAMGAFSGEHMIGLVFGFLGTEESSLKSRSSPRLKHCSHLLAVLPEYRDQQVGTQLKLAQRNYVLGQGLQLITWTYDPLEARNAALNIAHLGAVCETYLRNAYGEMQDALNRGLPSDRFQVDWWIASQRVTERLAGRAESRTRPAPVPGEVELLNPSSAAAGDDLPRPGLKIRALSEATILVEIPSHFQVLKNRDLDLARAWREQTREVFEETFANGYRVNDFIRTELEGRLCSFYILSRQGS